MKAWASTMLIYLLGAASAHGGDSAEKYLELSRDIAKQLTEQLGSALKRELSENGPAAAIKVCKNVAVDTAAQLSRTHGARVTRVSLKVRNPLLGTPDAWEQQGLGELERRLAAGDATQTLEVSEVVAEPQGRYFRYLKAIPVQPLCLACHGPAEGIPQPVKDTLATDYPKDQATGYNTGQLRGAISIKFPH